MKVIVIGAGQGGLYAAKLLAEGGVQVKVFEKDTKQNLCYDWSDDVENKVFGELGIPLPEGEYFRMGNWSFVPPFSDMCMYVEQPEQSRDWSIERRPLSDILVKMAQEKGAEIQFGTEVESLIIENGKVKGVVVAGQPQRCDLVVDCSGADSKFRASLPESYKIQKKPNAGEVFVAYRAFYNRAEGSTPPEKHTNKAYLKHLGEAGISWCIYDPSDTVNVLVGRIDALSDQTLQVALDDLRKNNPILGDKILHGGRVCRIPVRYPISRMVGDGYALIGDAAFMTIPMLGSGIANSFRAAKMLADCVLKDNSVDIGTLWKYQVKYYKQIGAGHASVDMLKRWLLATESKDVTFLFENKVISEDDFKAASTGGKVVLTLPQLLDKVKKGYKRLGVLLSLNSVLTKGNKAEKVALSIPEVFNDAAVTAWQKKLDSLYGN